MNGYIRISGLEVGYLVCGLRLGGQAYVRVWGWAICSSVRYRVLAGRPGCWLAVVAHPVMR